MPPVFATTSIVFLIQNILTRQFLMYNGSTAAMHSIKAHQGNFHLFGGVSDGVKHVQLFADSSTKLGLGSSTEDQADYLTPEFQGNATISNQPTSGSGDADGEQKCSASMDISSTENEWHVEYPKDNTNYKVRLYVLNESGEKWYLRAHFLGTQVAFVCEDYVNSISNIEEQFFSEQELKFNLVAVDVMELITNSN